MQEPRHLLVGQEIRELVLSLLDMLDSPVTSITAALGVGFGSDRETAAWANGGGWFHHKG